MQPFRQNSEAATFFDELRAALARLAPVRSGILGADLTTYAIGGPLELLCEPETQEQLIQVVELLKQRAVAWRILGAGSNILVADEGIKEVVIRLGRGFRGSHVLSESPDITIIEVGAAASLMTLSRTVSDQGLSGLEFAAGIPATIGGAVFMNAGAHGSEMAAVLGEITVLRGAGVERIAARSLPFRYRHSGLSSEEVVIGASFVLRRGDRELVARQRAECLAERKARQPLSSPSAGSVFKNPSPKLAAGRLIEEAGLKGLVQGGAQVSTLHANWIINPGRRASAREVEALMAQCVETVADRTGVVLDPEVIRWK